MTPRQAATRLRDAETRTVLLDGAEIVCREVGASDGIPLVALNHLAANLDNWDPRIIDPLAADRRVILIGYRGVGRSGGRVRTSIEEMAADAIAATRELGLDRFDLFGQSMGGMVAQEIVAQQPGLVDRLILASSAPAGGPQVVEMTRTMLLGILRAALDRANPTASLFFTRTAGGTQAGREYLASLRERVTDRDTAVSPRVLRAQLAAVHRWGQRPRAGTSQFNGPVAILHGDSDRMIPVANATALAQVFPAASVTVFPDSGHGAVFQHHLDVVVAARAFLRR
jgi:pimeloyl-ACP methyl ester carboxylesterase